MKPKILYLSDSALGITGYGNQTKEICKRAEQDFDVYHVGWNYTGQPLRYARTTDGEEFNFKILPGSMNAPYAQPILQEYIDNIQPDIFMCLLDTFMVYPWILNYNLGKSIFYYPSDGGWFPQNCEIILRKFTHPIAMSKFAQEQIRNTYGIRTEYIPHGTNTSIYYTLNLEMKAALRKKYSQIFNYDLTNKFIVGSVTRNQGRKMMDRTFKSFAELCKHTDNAVLMMHSDPRDPAAVSDLNYLASRLGIAHRIIWTGMNVTKGFGYQQMMELYNLFDVHFLSTSGEGFGIPTIEAMACEVPILQTDYTTTKEIVTDNGAGLGIKMLGETEPLYPAERMSEQIVGTWNVERGLCEIKDAAEKLKYLMDSPEERMKMGTNGRKAVLKYYDWNKVYPLWKKKFEEMLH